MYVWGNISLSILSVTALYVPSSSVVSALTPPPPDTVKETEFTSSFGSSLRVIVKVGTVAAEEFRAYMNNETRKKYLLGTRRLKIYIIIIIIVSKIINSTQHYTYVYTCFNERWEGRKKEASKVKQTNKAKQHSTPKAVHVYTCFNERWEGRKKETRQSNTAHPRQSLFLRKMHVHVTLQCYSIATYIYI